MAPSLSSNVLEKFKSIRETYKSYLREFEDGLQGLTVDELELLSIELDLLADDATDYSSMLKEELLRRIRGV